MRCCIVCRVLWPGGVQRLGFGFAAELKRRGHSVDLAFVRDSGREIQFGELPPYRNLNPAESKHRLFARLFAYVTASFNPERGSDATVDPDLIAKFELTRATYDVVLYLDQYAALFSMFSRLRHGERHIVMIQETALNKEILAPRIIERFVTSQCDGLLTNSTRNKSIMTDGGCKDVVVIPPGVSILKELEPFSSRRNVAVSTTMWDTGRHPEALLDIAASLDKGSLVLAGSWADSKAYNEFIRVVDSRGLSGKVAVTGPISDANLAALYDSSKVAIRFGYNELGPGIGALEAMGRGLPIIVNRGLGIHDDLESAGAGIIADDKAPDRTAKDLLELFGNETAWNLYSQSSLRFAARYSWDTIGDLLERALNPTTLGPESNRTGRSSGRQE